MTDLSLPRGDTRVYDIALLENAAALDLSAGAVVRTAIQKYECPMANTGVNTIAFWTSYDAGQLVIDDAVNGGVLWKFEHPDTNDAPLGEWYWALELVRPGAAYAPGGTMTVVDGSALVTLAGASFTDIQKGDIFEITSGPAANLRFFVITAVDSTGLTVTTDNLSWDPGAGLTFNIWRGDVKTPDGLSGRFTLTSDGVV